MKSLDDLIGLSVKNIFYETSTPSTAGYDEIILKLSDYYLKLIPDVETDELSIQYLQVLTLVG